MEWSVFSLHLMNSRSFFFFYSFGYSALCQEVLFLVVLVILCLSQKATKWSEKKEAVAELTKLASTKKIAPGDFTEVCRTLKKVCCLLYFTI